MSEKTSKKREAAIDAEKRWDRGCDILAFIALCLFVLSPVIQVIREWLFPHRVSEYFGNMRTYPSTVNMIMTAVILAATLRWSGLLMKTIQKFKEGERPKLFLPLVIFGALALWTYISQSINGFTDYALMGEEYRNESLLTFITYLMGYFFLGTTLRSERFRKALSIIFLGSNLVIGVLALIDRFGPKLRVFFDSEGMSAIFHQFNHYGYYLTMAILVAATLFIAAGSSLWIRIFSAVVFVVDNVILILNNTFGCYLAVILALLFGGVVIAIFRKNRGEWVRVAIVWAAFALITVVMHSLELGSKTNMSRLVSDIGKITSDDEKAASAGTGRWALWKHTVDYISEKPVVGWGVDGITRRLEAEKDTINDRPHNEYLQWAAFFGIPAALLYFAGLCVIMFGMFPRLKGSDSVSLACFVGAAGYIASAFVGNTMYYTAPFFFIILGMTCRDRFYGKQSDEASGKDAA
ncbi:MAG: O-antigen ligase family protein [Lachnospiraceae bacterium]|nr:O-antigen ligase family protein [Lachnospiraceae bacterium]